MTTRYTATAKTLQMATGALLNYDALLLATGGSAQPLKVPGGDLPNVFTLRIIDDASSIIAAAAKGAKAGKKATQAPNVPKKKRAPAPETVFVGGQTILVNGGFEEGETL